MFGRKAKELQDNTKDLQDKSKDLQQRVRLLESEVKRLTAILEFLSVKRKIPLDSFEDTNPSFTNPTNPTNPTNLTNNSSRKMDEVLISADCSQKIDKLYKVDFATKEDITRVDERFLEIFNTISALFARLGTGTNITNNASTKEEDAIF